MTTCPLCEHQQEVGDECQVCGHSLVARVEAEVLVGAIEGLEPTLLGEPGAVDEVEPLPGLEPTLQAGAGEVGADPVPDLEPTAAAPSGDAPTELPLFPVCRYCRTPTGPGERICGRCGMGLPIGTAPASPAGAPPRFCSCGTPVTRSICPACGARIQVA